MSPDGPGPGPAGAGSLGVEPLGADRLGTFGAAALALLGLSAFDVVSLPLLPSTAVGFLGVAVPFVAVLLLAGALAAERPRRPALRALALLVAASPALVAACCLASGGSVGLRVPGLGLLLALAVTLAFAAAPLRIRRGVAALLLACWGVDTVLATARIELLPAELNPVRQPCLELGLAGGACAPRWGPTPRGLRAGAPVRMDEVPGERGTWYRLAEEGFVPRDMPLVLVLGTPPEGLGERVVLPGPPGAEPPVGREAAVVRASTLPRHPYDLGGADMVVLAPDAWSAGGEASTYAQALERFVRLGGNLVLYGASATSGLVGDAFRVGGGLWTDESPAVRRFGAGVLWRAGDLAALRDALTRGLAAPPLRTGFDLAQPPPAPPGVLRPRVERGRLPLGLLLLAAALVVGLLEGGARTARILLASLGLPVLALLAGVGLLLPRGGDLGVTGLWLDLGGSGGRRIEALWLEAGERGYAGALQAGPTGLLRRVPGGGCFHVSLAPGAAEWLVIERERGAPPAGLREDRGAGWLAGLLLSEVPPSQLRFQRGPLPLVRLEGVALPEVQGLDVLGTD